MSHAKCLASKIYNQLAYHRLTSIMQPLPCFGPKNRRRKKDAYTVRDKVIGPIIMQLPPSEPSTLQAGQITSYEGRSAKSYVGVSHAKPLGSKIDNQLANKRLTSIFSHLAVLPDTYEVGEK